MATSGYRGYCTYFTDIYIKPWLPNILVHAVCPTENVLGGMGGWKLSPSYKCTDKLLPEMKPITQLGEPLHLPQSSHCTGQSHTRAASSAKKAESLANFSVTNQYWNDMFQFIHISSGTASVWSAQQRMPKRLDWRSSCPTCMPQDTELALNSDWHSRKSLLDPLALLHMWPGREEN